MALIDVVVVLVRRVENVDCDRDRDQYTVKWCCGKDRFLLVANNCRTKQKDFLVVVGRRRTGRGGLRDWLIDLIDKKR